MHLFQAYAHSRLHKTVKHKHMQRKTETETDGRQNTKVKQNIGGIGIYVQ